MRVFGQRALVLLVAGAGRYRDANGLRRDVTAGAAILVFPALAHRYGPQAGQKWDEIYLCFDGPIFDVWEREKMWDASRPIARLERGETATVYARLRALCEQPRPADDAENWRQLQTLLSLLIEIFPPRARPTEADVAASGARVIGGEFERKFGNAPMLPAKLGAVTRHFAAISRPQPAFSPLQYRTRKRLESRADFAFARRNDERRHRAQSGL